MNIKEYFKMMIDKNASDMFYRAGANVRMRIDGKVVIVDERTIARLSQPSRLRVTS